MRLKGNDLDGSIVFLRQLAQDCQSLYAHLSDAYADGRGKYLDWADAAERQLRARFVDEAVVQGLYSERYWRIAEGTVLDRHPQLIGSEIRVQVERLTALAEQLQNYLGLRNRPGAIVMLDTNVLLHYQCLDKVPWREVAGEGPVRLVIPLLVLEELDDKRYLSGAAIKDKARGAVKPLDRRQNEFDEQGYATLPDGATVEYLLDDPNHLRRSNPDEEFLDRAEFLQLVTHQPVRIVTADRSMRVRATARGGGLRATLMPQQFSRDQEESKETRASDGQA